MISKTFSYLSSLLASQIQKYNWWGERGECIKTNFRGSNERSRRSWYIKLPWLGLMASLEPVGEAGEPQSKAIHVWGAGSIGWGSSQDLILFLCKCRIEDIKLSGLEDINDWTIMSSLAETQTWNTAAMSAFTGSRGTSHFLSDRERPREGWLLLIGL